MSPSQSPKWCLDRDWAIKLLWCLAIVDSGIVVCMALGMEMNFKAFWFRTLKTLFDWNTYNLLQDAILPIFFL
jgi:hypothetical protein